MARPIGWTKALHRYAAEMNGREFVWGSTDCGTLVREAVAIVVGEAAWDVSYTTPAGATRALKRLGGPETALEGAGGIQVPLSYAMQGDVLVNPDPDDHVAELGIVVGNGMLGATMMGGAFWRSGLPAWTCWRLPGGSTVGTDG